MNLQSLYIGNHKYLVEFIDNCNESAQFVMIRNFTFINNIIIDKDIYFIQKEIFNKYINELQEGDNIEHTVLSFPIPDTKNSGFSKLYSEFNPAIFKNSLVNLIDGKPGNAVYELYRYNENDEHPHFEETYIPCYKLKIYHPVTKTNINAVVHVDNYMNGIHFHYLCNEYNNFNYDSETEIVSDNQFFSEYIEILIPNIIELFGYNHDTEIKLTNNGEKISINKHIYNVYYKENMGFAVSSKNPNFLKQIIFEDPTYEDYITPKNGKFIQYAPLALMLQPYAISTEISYLDINTEEPVTQQVKVYYKNKILIENNQLSMPFSVKIYPYSEYDTNNNIYILDPDYTDDTCTFIKEYKLELSSYLSFDQGKVSICSEFVFPGFDNSITKFYELYKYLYSINPEDYDIDKYVPEIKELSKIDSISTDMKNSMTHWLKDHSYDTPLSETEWHDRFIEMRKESIIREYEEEMETPINFIGYEIEIASDINFKHVLYKLFKTSDITQVDKFAFNINNIFENWKEKPEVLIARTKFIDRYTGLELISNYVTITNEWFIYLIHDYDDSRINFLNKQNDNMKKIIATKNNDTEKQSIIDDIDSIIDMLNTQDISTTSLLNEPLVQPSSIPTSYPTEYSTANPDNYHNNVNEIKNKLNNIKNVITENFGKNVPINFINSINCIVARNEKELVHKNNDGQKLIFKPIFYKVADLQNIQIRANVIQNVAINLSDYMTKTTTFKLNINGTEIVEMGRNNIYVMFRIDPKKYSSTSGKYDITNQDDEYISSGNWTII